MTALHHAVLAGEHDLVQWLCNRNARVDCQAEVIASHLLIGVVSMVAILVLGSVFRYSLSVVNDTRSLCGIQGGQEINGNSV